MKKYLQASLLGSLGSVSGTSTYLSQWQLIDSFESYMIQVVYTGSPVANISLVVSADLIPAHYTDPSTLAPTNYDYVTNSQVATSSITAGPSGSYIQTYEVTKSSGNWVAFRWVNASGTGVIKSVQFVGKGSLV